MFWISIAGIVSAGLGVIVSASLKSRCQKVSFCCFSCERDTASEDAEALAQISRGGSAVAAAV